MDKTIKILLTGLLLIPTAVFAHTEGDGQGFISGILHPVLGYDHLLAMLSVGILSAQLGGNRIWTVPSLFVLSMVAGGILGFNHVLFPFVEAGVACSVIVLGVGIMLAHKETNVILIMLFVAFFGALHGHAHGVEMPKAASPVFYSFGFVVSTSLIHLLGVFVGHTLTVQEKLQRALTFVGAMVSGAGLFILYGLL